MDRGDRKGDSRGHSKVGSVVLRFLRPCCWILLMASLELFPVSALNSKDKATLAFAVLLNQTLSIFRLAVKGITWVSVVFPHIHLEGQENCPERAWCVCPSTQECSKSGNKMAGPVDSIQRQQSIKYANIFIQVY